MRSFGRVNVLGKNRRSRTHRQVIWECERLGEEVIVLREQLLNLHQVAGHGAFAAQLQHAVEVVDFLHDGQCSMR